MIFVARLYGGPQDGLKIALPKYRPCVEWLLLPDGNPVFLSDKGSLAPDNLEIAFDRYISRRGSETYRYMGRFKESYYG